MKTIEDIGVSFRGIAIGAALGIGMVVVGPVSPASGQEEPVCSYVDQYGEDIYPVSQEELSEALENDQYIDSFGCVTPVPEVVLRAAPEPEKVVDAVKSSRDDRAQVSGRAEAAEAEAAETEANIPGGPEGERRRAASSEDESAGTAVAGEDQSSAEDDVQVPGSDADQEEPPVLPGTGGLPLLPLGGLLIGLGAFRLLFRVVKDR